MRTSAALVRARRLTQQTTVEVLVLGRLRLPPKMIKTTDPESLLGSGVSAFRVFENGIKQQQR